MNTYRIHRKKSTIYRVSANTKKEAINLLNINYKNKNLSIIEEDLEIKDSIELISSTDSESVIDVISYGNVFNGEGFKAQGRYGGGLRMFVRDYDNNWFTTNNRDWEPEIDVLPTVTFNIVTKFKKKKYKGPSVL